MRVTTKEMIKFSDLWREYYDTIVRVVFTFSGISQAITVLLTKYHLGIEHFYFGVAGQAFIIMYRYNKNPEREIKSIKNIVSLSCHLILAGFVSMLFTSIFIELYFEKDSIFTASTSVAVGASYQLVTEMALSTTSSTIKIIGRRAKMAFEILLYGEKKGNK